MTKMYITNNDTLICTTHPYCETTNKQYKLLQEESHKNAYFAGILRYLNKNGYLTSKQQATVLQLEAAVDAKATATTNHPPIAPLAPVTKDMQFTHIPAILLSTNISEVVGILINARSNGIKIPHIALKEFTLKLRRRAADSTSYVAITYHGNYIGGYYCEREEFAESTKYYSRDKLRTIVTELNKLLDVDDIKESMAATGRATGICQCCGRELTNAESITLGIGPICLTNYFG